MKQLFFILLMCSPSMTIAQEDSGYAGIQWTEGLSWEQLKAKAKKENKYIFVDYYATWCVPCKKMDSDIYSQSRIDMLIRDKFISVKVQADTTVNDNEYVKSWYSTAHQFLRNYNISGFPTYLFFTPEGNLIHKDAGYKDENSFIQMFTLTKDPQKSVFYTQYEIYKKGRIDDALFGKLAIFTKRVIGDREIAIRMAKEYKEKYLNHLDSADLYTRENLSFISTFPNLVSSDDLFFQLAYSQPKRYDSILGWPNADRIVIECINRELDVFTLKNGKPIRRAPKWGELHSYVSRYKLLNTNRLLLEYKVNYYKKSKDWRSWAACKDELIKNYPLTPPYGNKVYIELNVDGAWHAFLHCNDSNVLKKALEWADLALQLQPEWKDAYLDTKANLLYKLGRIEEAIQHQEWAVANAIERKLDNDYIKSMQKAVNQMKKGEPTYLDDGAEWEFSKLPSPKK